MAENLLRELVIKLYEIQAVKFGDFTLKSGIQSPVYFDLRVIISYPKIMVEVAELLHQASLSCSVPYKSVCGVPYTALPLATLISANHDIPMLIRRKESKSYGTKKLIEGHFSSGDNCLIVEDVVTSGSSVFETYEALSSEGIEVKDAVVLLDRCQGGKQRLASCGITLHSIISMSDMVEWLLEEEKIDQSMHDRIIKFIADNQCPQPSPVADIKVDTSVLDYGVRAKCCVHPMSAQLLEIMNSKKTNLAFSADVSDSKMLLELADKVGPYVCVIKTHMDEVDDFDLSVAEKLKELSKKHNFLIFEDRKFADIGNTVRHQFEGGVYQISKWADIVNAHSLPGPGIVAGLKQVDARKGCLLIAEMSSAGSLFTPEYTRETVHMAESNKDFVLGFISTRRVSEDPSLIHFTPGIHLASKGDQCGQQYLTPHEVIFNRRSDIIIVGRGILNSDDVEVAARTYRDAGFSAYLELLKNKS